MKTTALAEDLAVGAVAGYLGTKAMEPVSQKLYELESEQDRQREDEARPGPPYQIAAQKTLGVLGVDLDGKPLERAGMAFHYGLAIGWAPLYALLRRAAGMGPLTAGLTSGTAMWLVVDEGLTPALGFSAPNREYPAATHVRGFLAHVAFGLALAGVTEAAWRLRGPRGRDARPQRPTGLPFADRSPIAVGDGGSVRARRGTQRRPQRSRGRATAMVLGVKE